MRAAELRGTELPAGHFTDPLDARLGDIAAAGLSASERCRRFSTAAGFASGSGQREAVKRIVAEHLEDLRSGGVEAALSAMSGDRAS